MRIPYTNIQLGRNLKEIKAVDERKPKRSGIIDKIEKEIIFQTRKDIQDWNRAVDRARSVLRPSRTDLMDIYRDISIDGHLSGIITSIKNKIKSRSFHIVDENEVEDEDMTKNFQKKWFYDFLGYAIDAFFYGYSLVQLNNIKNDYFESIELVPREYVIPEWNGIKRRLRTSVTQNQVIRYDEPPYDRWTIFIGSNELGLFNKIVPHAIGKKNLLISCWEYAELFGMPLRTTYTDLTDEQRRKNAENMLKNMGSAGWGVLDKDDKIEITARGGSDASQVFISPFELHNKEMSKAIGGQTGVFDEKAFVGSTETHAELFEEFCDTYATEIEYEVNNDLIPKMILHRIPLDGKIFKFVDREKLTLLQKVTIIKDLAPVVKFEEGFIEEYTGLKIEQKEAVEPNKQEDEKSIMKEVNDIYNKLDHGQDN